MEAQWKGWGQFFLGIGITALFFYMMAPFMVATLLGAVMAVICHPLHDRWKKRIPASLSAVGVTSLLALGIFLPILLLLYFCAYRLLQIVSHFKVLKGGPNLDSLLTLPFLGKTVSSLTSMFQFDREWLKNQSVEVIGDVTEKVSGWVTSSLAGMPGLMLGIAVIILSLFFFLVDGEKLLRFLGRLSPLTSERSLELFKVFESSCRAVVIGLFASALAQGCLITLFFFITRLPSPFLFGAMTVGMGMVPLVGAGPIWIGATIYLFAKSKVLLGVIMLVGGLIISTCDNVIRTWIMSGKAEMHPFLALVSVFGALNLVGASGIFLGPIIAAIFVSFLRIMSQEVKPDHM